MRRYQYLVMALVAAAVIPMADVSQGALFLGRLWHRNPHQAWRTAQADGRAMLVFFTTDSCHFCDKMQRDTLTDQEVERDIERSYVAAAVNESEYPELAAELGIRAFPTTVIVQPDGTISQVIRGYAGPDLLREELQAAVPTKFVQR